MALLISHVRTSSVCHPAIRPVTKVRCDARCAASFVGEAKRRIWSLVQELKAASAALEELASSSTNLRMQQTAAQAMQRLL